MCGSAVQNGVAKQALIECIGMYSLKPATNEAVRCSNFIYNFFFNTAAFDAFDSLNHPVTFYTAHLKDMHQSLTSIS